MPTDAPTAHRRVHVGIIAVLLLGFSTLRFPAGWYVAANLGATVALLLLAGRLGLSRGELGLEAGPAGVGLRWGGWAALVAGLVLAGGAAIPALRPLFDDARTAGIGPGLLAYRALVRIPLGTALLEEVAFRGVLFSAWRRRSTVRVAAVGSSIVFGLWHIRPAFDLLAENDVSAGGPGRALAVLAAVAGTTVAGVVFCWLRVGSGSLVAPYLAHAALNSLATIAAFVV